MTQGDTGTNNTSFKELKVTEITDFNTLDQTTACPLEKGFYSGKCAVCKKVFTASQQGDLKKNIKRHNDTVHLKMKPYQCPFCSKKCSRKDNLMDHVKSRHGDKNQ